MPNYNLTPPNLKPKDLQRFHQYVPQLASDVCWPWIGAPSEGGYGFFRLFGGRRTRGGHSRAMRTDMAHRVQHFLYTGEWPEAVLHKCDNPPCVNPSHLRSGTQVENIEDCKAKGRIGFVKGTEQHCARLNEDSVRYIRRNWRGNGGTLSHAQMAKILNVAKGTVSQVTAQGKHRTWKHVE